MVIAYESGLVEIVNVEEREILSSFLFLKPVVSVLGYIKDGFAKIFVHIKCDSVKCMCVNTDGTWEQAWSFNNPTAVSFAKMILNMQNGAIVFPSSGQNTVSVARIEDGYLLGEVQISNSNRGVAGMISAMTHKSCSHVSLLTESGHVVTVDLPSCDIVSTEEIRFPGDPHVDSIIPISLEYSSGGVCSIGYSNGIIQKIDKDVHEWYKDTRGSGISCIKRLGEDKYIIATWKGSVAVVDDNGLAVVVLKTPHTCNLSQVAATSQRVAVASTDGRVSIWVL